MRASSLRQHKKRQDQLEQIKSGGCSRALCCSSCRLSVSSSEEAESTNSDRFASVSSLAHAMVQEREDFRESMVEMIMANRIREPKDLRSLLNYYVSMNSDEYHGVILEVFHEVCSRLFLSCKGHYSYAK
uniref:Transcription repressor n=1 Tax=Cannabis sativa TaxID=3483 RepID=A0A803NYV1_CANSA